MKGNPEYHNHKFTGKYLKCSVCGKEFYSRKCRWHNNEFCSNDCRARSLLGKHLSPRTEFIKGQVGWNKGRVLLEKQNEGNPNWKGNEVGYHGIHKWVERHKGKPDRCIDCGVTSKEKRISWSNKDHKYRRELSDYEGRCASCHKLYDIKNGLIGRV